jgi:hypothetical protein
VLVWMISTAHAASPEFAVGGHVGTWFLPAAYPYAFPKQVVSYDFARDGLADDVTGDGEPDRTTLTGVRGDMGFGLDAYTWLSSHVRFGVTTHAAFAPRFTDVHAVFVLGRTGRVGRAQGYLGGGVGFGKTTWTGKDDDEQLLIPSYPVRAEASLGFPFSDFAGIDLRIIGQLLVPSRHVYTDVSGGSQAVTGMPTNYATLGLQVGFLAGRLR